MTLDKLLKITDKLDYLFPPFIKKEEAVENIASKVSDKLKGREEELREKGWFQPLNGSFSGSFSFEKDSIINAYAKHYANDIIPEFSPSFFFIYKHLSEKILFPNLIKSVNITEEKGVSNELKKISYKNPVVILPNHVSNADHIPVCYALNKIGLKQPSIAAGANLYYGSSAKLLPKLNAYKLRRDEIKPGVQWLSNPIYKNTHSEFLKYMMDNNQPLMFYIEGGRSRDGFLKDPKVGILKELINYSKTGKSVFLAPIGISYTCIYEDTMLEESRKGMKITDSNLLKQLKEMDKNYKQFTSPEINVHLNDIIEINPDFLKKTKIRDISGRIMDDLKKAIIPTPTYNIANSMVKLNSYTFSKKDLEKIRLEELTNKNNNETRPLNVEYVNSEINKAFDVFFKKGFVSKNGYSYMIENEPLIRQYANRKITCEEQ